MSSIIRSSQLPKPGIPSTPPTSNHSTKSLLLHRRMLTLLLMPQEQHSRRGHRVPFSERAKLLLQYADLIEVHRTELEKLLVKEQGKPLGLAKMEFDMTLEWLRAFTRMEIKDDVLDEND